MTSPCQVFWQRRWTLSSPSYGPYREVSALR